MKAKIFARGGSGNAHGQGGEGTVKAEAIAVNVGRFTGYLGKGLREPCSPYRTAYYFGAELNVPVADNWNCPPAIVDPAPTYDLSTLVPPKEVCVALFNGTGLTSGGDIEITYYRNRDDTRIFIFTHTIPDPRAYGWDYWEWYYVYAYVGYTSWEIFEDGDYRVEFGEVGEATGIVIPFTITGIEPLPTDLNVVIRKEGNGTTDPAPGTYQVAEGVFLAVEAFPASGWEFDRFVVEPGGTFTTNPVEVMIEQDTAITAVFTEIEPKPPGKGFGLGKLLVGGGALLALFGLLKRKH